MHLNFCKEKVTQISTIHHQPKLVKKWMYTWSKYHQALWFFLKLQHQHFALCTWLFSVWVERMTFATNKALVSCSKTVRCTIPALKCFILNIHMISKILVKYSFINYIFTFHSLLLLSKSVCANFLHVFMRVCADFYILISCVNCNDVLYSNN